MLAISAEALEVKTSDWPDYAALELLWLTRTAETGRPTTLGELVYPGNQPAENDQSVTTNPPAFLALTRHFPSSRVSLEEAEGWVMRSRGTGCHSWCYYCRYDDQYRPSPWQSPWRHVTMVSVVMTLVAMVIFPPVECQVASTWLPAASCHHQHRHLINSWRAELLTNYCRTIFNI